MQGKWLGFRSAATGDRFLQARKRSNPSRLVFFSQNVGTWEQWELGSGAPDPDTADWASLVVMLCHRRLPQFELAVEIVRVGSVSLAPNASVTPRSLQALGAAGAEQSVTAAADEDSALERRELQRMSGILVHVSGVSVAIAALLQTALLLIVGQHALHASWGSLLWLGRHLHCCLVAGCSMASLVLWGCLGFIFTLCPAYRSGCTMWTKRRRHGWPLRRACCRWLKMQQGCASGQ